jgi:hypothetical protein
VAATETLTQRVGHLLKGRYRVDRVLHSGAHSTVYAGVDIKGGRVAIKVLEGERDASLLRSSYLANAVGHPSAVNVLESGSTDDGVDFVVMELLEATSMAALMQQHEGHLPLRFACNIADQGLELLTCAHAQGIVHGALEPRKLVFTHTERLKVLGFGKPASEQACADDVRSLTNAVVWLLAGEQVASLRGGALAPERIAGVLERGLSDDPERRWKSADAMRTALQLACKAELGRPVDRSLRPLSGRMSFPPPLPTTPTTTTQKRSLGSVWLAGVGAALVALFASLQLFEMPEAQATAPEPQSDVSAAAEPAAEAAPSDHGAAAHPERPEHEAPLDALPADTEATEPPRQPLKKKSGVAGKNLPASTMCAQLTSVQRTRSLSHEEATLFRSECSKP